MTALAATPCAAPNISRAHQVVALLPDALIVETCCMAVVAAAQVPAHRIAEVLAAEDTAGVIAAGMPRSAPSAASFAVGWSGNILACCRGVRRTSIHSVPHSNDRSCR